MWRRGVRGLRGVWRDGRRRAAGSARSGSEGDAPEGGGARLYSYMGVAAGAERELMRGGPGGLPASRGAAQAHAAHAAEGGHASGERGAARARSQSRVAPPRIHAIPDM